jgi:hypothetical protein
MKHKIDEEIVFKTYEDNALIQFEVTLCEFPSERIGCMIHGLPDHGEIKDLETLERIIGCLQAARKKWKTL